MAAPSPDRTRGAFGPQLRYWRKLRGLSQLDLALETGCSPRHVSFIETGRSRPRAPTVLKLTEALDVPLRDRNELLRAAGLPPAYPEASLDDASLERFRRIVRIMLERHEPYPAYVVDRLWRIVDMNEAARRLMPPEARTPPIDGLRLFFAPGPAQLLIENWPEIAWLGLARLRREAAAAGNAALVERVNEIEAEVAAVCDPPAAVTTDAPVLCPRLRVGDRSVGTVTTIARFGSAQDVTLDELRVELVFPADDDAAAFFEAMAAG